MKEENLYTPNCIRTVSGIYVNVFDPRPEMICIEDIAHSLSHQCRFGGHLPDFYSVAQHSVSVSQIVEESDRLAALLHDASEAYLVDMPSPIKKGLPNYKMLESNLMKVIARKFGFEYPLTYKVKEADVFALEWEWHTLVLKDTLMSPIRCFDFGEAKALFLDTFNNLLTNRNESNKC